VRNYRKLRDRAARRGPTAAQSGAPLHFDPAPQPSRREPRAPSDQGHRRCESAATGAHPSRREFLSQLALLSASLAAGCRPRARGPAAPPTFAGGRAATLAAACARILPTDHEPGAAEAGCAGFIDRQLGLPHFDALRRAVERGLEHLDQLAQRAHGRAFAACGPAEQDALLVKLRDERRRGLHGGQVFGLLLTLTLEGFLSDPRHGGNRGEVGWRFAAYTPCWFHGGGRGAKRRPAP
jgi:hypothetical protein